MRNDIAWAPVALFVVMFLWTPPHFWALAIRYADDYRAAQVPMLPAVATPQVTVRKMVTYTAAMVVGTLVLWPLGHLGLIYGIATERDGGDAVDEAEVACSCGAPSTSGSSQPRSDP